jgi:hypothetical protein
MSYRRSDVKNLREGPDPAGEQAGPCAYPLTCWKMDPAQKTQAAQGKRLSRLPFSSPEMPALWDMLQ